MGTKIGEVENKFPDVSGLATTDVLNTKLGEIENAIPDLSKIVKKRKIMTLKEQTLKGNISLLLIIVHLQVRYLIQR